MIVNSALENILTNATDFAVVVEFYSADAAPPFDPNDALLRFSSVAGLSFFGAEYTELVKNFGRIKRTINAELNTAQVELSNLDRTASDYEFNSGFEALIKVVRLISRNASDTLEKSLVLFAGRCERPTGGTRESVSIDANQIFGAIDAEIPRRKFSPDDPNGLPPQDPNFEGFRFIPQYGTIAYSSRERRGGLLGLFGFKHNVTRHAEASSHSDIDAERYLPVAFGRVQVYGMHLAYVDLGTTIRFTTAFLEGKIEDYVNWRTDDTRFSIYGTVHKRFGYAAGDGPSPYEQVPVPGATPDWVGNGYYARTALIFSQVLGTNVQDVDAAPGVIVVALATLVTVPDGGGDWAADNVWSDNPAAHARFLITSDDYGKLSSAWLNDESFFNSHQYNDQIIFDSSGSDLLFVPDTTNFAAGDKDKGRYFLSTGHLSTNYFKMLAGGKTAAETFLLTSLVEPYSSAIPIEPPDRVPTDPGGTAANNLTFFLRRRYTCNVVVSEQTKVTDFVHNSIFTTCRGFLSQDEQGRLKLNNKKPVDWCLAVDAITTAVISVDDVSPFIVDQSGFLLIDPHTANAEIRQISAAVYSSATPGLSGSANLSITGFSGGDGASVPQTASVEVGSIAAGDISTITFDEAEFSFTAGSSDDSVTVAGFLYGAINAHPVLRRRYRAAWTPGDKNVAVTLLAGTITLTEAAEKTHGAPESEPVSGPTLADSSGALAAGDYKVCYSFANSRGETLPGPLDSITIGANKKIDVSSVSPPPGCTVRWYCSPAADSLRLRLVKENDGSAFSITALPKLSDPGMPEFNRTGAEVMRVAAVFSDRSDTSASATRANVLKATFKWNNGTKKTAIKNQINLKFRDSTQDFRLIELIERDDEHIAKIKKVNKLEINGQGIDNYHQAKRIATGLLAENLDANFLYEWSSDRAALLVEEGDVVALADHGSGILNFPVRVETIEFDPNKGLVRAGFTARKYSTTLYDDSVAERTIPVIVETTQGVDYV